MRNTDILIVDDEIGIREILQETLEDEGYTVALAENAETARQMRNQTRPAMVLLDIWMPDSDGITLLKEWAANGQLTMPVVMMSGHGSIDTAVEATKIGALDFLEKPIPLQKLLATVERALQYSEKQAISSEIKHTDNAIVDETLRVEIESALAGKDSILLYGENGIAFDKVAALFQQKGSAWVEATRNDHLDEIAAELLEKAAGGFLYLGDIAHCSGQTRRVIEFLLEKSERSQTRLLMSCTTENPSWLEALQKKENIALSTIKIPALRSQKNKIPALVMQMAEQYGREANSFSMQALEQIMQYDWPGNEMQLRYVVASLLMTHTEQIGEQQVRQALSYMGGSNIGETNAVNFDQSLRDFREQLESHYFEYHIEKENRNMSRVAQKAGLERTHLYRKLKQLGIVITRNENKREVSNEK